MKLLIYIIGLFLSGTLLSCEKKDLTLLPEQALGEAVAIRNGEIWKASATAVPYSVDSNYLGIIIDWYEPANGYLRESMDFSVVNPRNSKGKICVKSHGENIDLTQLNYMASLFFTLQDDGDVLGDKFSVTDSPRPDTRYPWRKDGNYFMVTDWDEEAGIIKARFQVTYKRDPDWKDGKITAPWLPDRLEFTEGYIHAKVTE